jgi:hypothetical protein
MRSAPIDKDARGIFLPREQVESYLTNNWPVFTAVAQRTFE